MKRKRTGGPKRTDHLFVHEENVAQLTPVPLKEGENGGSPILIFQKEMLKASNEFPLKYLATGISKFTLSFENLSLGPIVLRLSQGCGELRELAEPDGNTFLSLSAVGWGARARHLDWHRPLGFSTKTGL